jgi:hypothetical protein
LDRNKLYQVCFTFDDEPEISGVMSYHTKVVAKMVSQGIVISHSITKQKKKIYIVFRVSGESELLFHLEKLPLMPFSTFDYERLESIEVYSVFSTYSLN